MGFRLPHQQQLILQQPNGLIWMRVCAKLRIFPTLQQVHQYDAALKLVTDDGHKASDEIDTCIVSEQHKHLMQQKQQQQAVSVSKQRLTAVMASKAPLTAPPPLVSHTYGERSYSVCSMSPPMPLANCPYLSLQDGSQYAGEFKEGKFHGVGTFKFAIGGYYSGQWFATRAHVYVREHVKINRHTGKRTRSMAEVSCCTVQVASRTAGSTPGTYPHNPQFLLPVHLIAHVLLLQERG